MKGRFEGLSGSRETLQISKRFSRFAVKVGRNTHVPKK